MKKYFDEMGNNITAEVQALIENAKSTVDEEYVAQLQAQVKTLQESNTNLAREYKKASAEIKALKAKSRTS